MDKEERERLQAELAKFFAVQREHEHMESKGNEHDERSSTKGVKDHCGKEWISSQQNACHCDCEQIRCGSNDA